jgi:hypothetical protein
VLGGKLKILSTLGFFLCLSISAQTEVTTSSHTEGTKAIEFSYNKGKNHIATSFSGMYYYRDNIHLKLFVSLGKFSYKSYSEEILEVGSEVGITLWEGDTRGRNQFFSSFNLTPIGGFSYELLKGTSETILIDEYLKHFYVYLGGNLEYSLSESFGINLFLKEFYAVNGSKDKLGLWRYNFGVSLRYYMF